MILNCTSHTIVLKTPQGDVVFPPSGIIPRMTSTEVEQTLTESPYEGWAPQVTWPVVKTSFGKVENLPDPVDGTYLLVSTLLAQANPHRNDLIAPDTGKTAIRENGQVVAVSRFQSFAD